LRVWREEIYGLLSGFEGKAGEEVGEDNRLVVTERGVEKAYEGRFDRESL